MPRYEYRCRTCDDHFELQRSMNELVTDAACPSGHRDTVRVFSAFATTGGSSFAASTDVVTGGGGGCCGGSCGCG